MHLDGVFRPAIIAMISTLARGTITRSPRCSFASSTRTRRRWDPLQLRGSAVTLASQPEVRLPDDADRRADLQVAAAPPPPPGRRSRSGR